MRLIPGLSKSLYSVSYYREIIQSSVSRGFLYLTLWAFITTGLVTMTVLLRFYPEANRFLEWFRAEMPVITLKPEGAQIDRPSPYEMKHPRYGHVVTFDMNRKEVPETELGEAMLFVTSTKLYMRQGRKKEMRVYDLTNPDVKTKEPAVIDAAFVKKMEGIAKPWVLIIVAAVFFVLFFIWKLIAALFYSLIALLFNSFREPRLNYESLLNVAFFSMTASLWINTVEIFTGIIRMPFGLLGSIVITATYLYLGVKFTEDPHPPVYL